MCCNTSSFCFTGRLRVLPIIVVSVIAFISNIAPAVCSTSITTVDPQGYFPFALGESWRFSGRNSGTDAAGNPYSNTYTTTMLITGTKLVGGVETTVLYESNPGNIGQPDENYLVKNSLGITNYGSKSNVGLSGQLAPYQELRFPVTVGDSLVQLDKSGLDLGMDLDSDGRNESFNARSILSVAGIETVQVPAGSFAACVKLERSITLTITLSASGAAVNGSDISVMWLAPGVGPVKKTETMVVAGRSDTVIEELIEYLVDGQGAGLSNGPLGFASNPKNLVARNGTVYWTDDSTSPVKRQSVKGGAAEAVVQKLGNVLGFAANAHALFWIEEQGGIAPSGCAGYGVIRVLKQLPAGGGTVTELAAGDACSGGTPDLVVDESFAYWVNSQATPNSFTVRRVPIAGGAAETLITTNKQIVGMAADQTHIYWVEEGLGPITFPDAPEGSTIRRIAKTGGLPQLLVDGTLNGRISPPVSPFESAGSWFPRGGIAVSGGELFFGDTNFIGRYRLFNLSTSGGNLTELASVTTTDGSNYIRKVAADAANVTWLDQAGIKTVPITGGTPQTLASMSMQPLDMVLAAGRVYWTESSGQAHGETGTIKSVPLIGGDVETHVQGGDAPRQLAAAGIHLYWSEGGAVGQIEGFGRLARLPLGGGVQDTVLLAVGGSSSPLAVDDQNLYVGSSFRIVKIPVGGGSPETVARCDDKVAALASDGSFVYWLEGPFSAVRRVPVGGGPIETLFASNGQLAGVAGVIRVSAGYVYWMVNHAVISRMPLAGGPIETIVNGTAFISDFVTDGVNIYFSDQDTGNIRAVPVVGGVPATIANGLKGARNNLALDSNFLYWVDQVHIGRVPRAGGNPIYLVAGGLNNDPLVPAGITVDAGSLYWTETASGAVMKLTPLSKPGDCDNDGQVTIAEVQSAINMFLGLKTVEACVDKDGAGGVSIAEVQKTINSFLGL